MADSQDISQPCTPARDSSELHSADNSSYGRIGVNQLEDYERFGYPDISPKFTFSFPSPSAILRLKSSPVSPCRGKRSADQLRGGCDKENDPSPAKRQKTRHTQSLVDADLYVDARSVLEQEFQEYRSYMKDMKEVGKKIARTQDKIQAMLRDIEFLIQK